MRPRTSSSTKRATQRAEPRAGKDPTGIGGSFLLAKDAPRCPKEVALEAVRRLPANVSWPQVTYRLELIRDLQRAVDDARVGGVANVRDLRRQVAEWDRLRVTAERRAKRLFRSIEGARAWLISEIPSLGFKTPLQVLKTPGGLQNIENLLGRIEHGIY